MDVEGRDFPINNDGRIETLARRALPVLVRQARAGQPLSYKQLGAEIDSHWRPMGDALGIIGDSLEDLSEAIGAEIPPIQAFAVNNNTGVPGDKFARFTSFAETYESGTTEEKKIIAGLEQQRAQKYQHWSKVLDVFGLPQPERHQPDLPTPGDMRTKLIVGGQDPEESEEHKELKEFVADNPESVGLSSTYDRGITEYQFRSLDRADVLFKGKKWVAVEVKSSKSGPSDILRGMFQCAKYKALLEATMKVEGDNRPVEAVLGLEEKFPAQLTWVKHILGTTVCDTL